MTAIAGSAVLPKARLSAAYATGSLADAHDHMAAFMRPHRLTLTDRTSPFAMRHQSVRLGNVRAHWLAYGGHVQMSSEAMERFYLFQINLRGACEVRLGNNVSLVRALECCPVMPNQALTKTWQPDCAQMILQVDRAAFDRFAADELGELGFAGLEFGFGPVAIDPALTGLVEMIDLIRRTTTAEDLAMPNARLTQHFETMVMSMLLSGLPHRHAGAYARVPIAYAPFHVRRAEDHIQAHIRELITIDDLAAASGASVRTLFSAFQHYRGMTPMNYVKALRLKLAYAELTAATPLETSVTAIALGCGFRHLGNFARDFRDAYGIAPSALLRS